MKRAKVLYQLQVVETDIEQKSRRLKEVEAALGESDELRQARSALEKAQKRLKEAKVRLQQFELENQSLQGEITTEEGRLYSGRIANPKELGSLENKIKNLKQRRSKVEDDLLQAMVDIEDAEAYLAVCQGDLTRLETTWETSQANLIEERDRLTKEMAKHRADRDALRSAISPPDMSLYENLRRRKGGQGVAKIVDGACRGCGVTVPGRQAQAAYDTDDIVQCGSCDRILFGER
jgi:hypothetical protein